MRFITPLLLLGLSIGAFFYFIKPEYGKILSTKQDIGSYDGAIVRAEQVGQKRQDLLAKLNSFSPSDIDRLNKLLPDSVDDIRFIIEVNSLAGRHASSISDIHISSSESSKTAGQTNTGPAAGLPYGIESLGFSVSMTYDQFLAFLSDIENSLRITDVGSLAITPSDKSSVYDYTMTLNTYWLK